MVHDFPGEKIEVLLYGSIYGFSRERSRRKSHTVAKTVLYTAEAELDFPNSSATLNIASTVQNVTTHCQCYALHYQRVARQHHC